MMMLEWQLKGRPISEDIISLFISDIRLAKVVFPAVPGKKQRTRTGPRPVPVRRWDEKEASSFTPEI
jgi:hypothetical protein